jgi:hypothetical protein
LLCDSTDGGSLERRRPDDRGDIRKKEAKRMYRRKKMSWKI